MAESSIDENVKESPKDSRILTGKRLSLGPLGLYQIQGPCLHFFFITSVLV